MPRLTKDLVQSPENSVSPDVDLPPPEAFYLPEKILQFGSGRFLRGFVDYFVDRANRQGLYDGRIVVVQTTGSGRTSLYNEQDGLFTLWERGSAEADSGVTDSMTLIASVSRAISAAEQWDEVLRLARSPDLECIVSNTTEIGITLDSSDTLSDGPPRSFPGKLTAVLLERGRAFDWAPDNGLVILPCELLDNNGDVLRDCVIELGQLWELGADFDKWVKESVIFCNTLVDRIVASLDRQEPLHAVAEQIGYEDHLLTVAEAYRHWAIEGDTDLYQRLPFLYTERSIVVDENIERFRERKIRILNGGHTSFVALAYLSGFDTVAQAMHDDVFSEFVNRTVFQEITPTVLNNTEVEFAGDVMSRFNNPLLEHLLLNITVQGTAKWRVRLVPTIKRYYAWRRFVPRRILLGLAAHILFLRGRRDDEHYDVVDQFAPRINEYWSRYTVSTDAQFEEFVRAVTADDVLWGEDLSQIEGLVEETADSLMALMRYGPMAAIRRIKPLWSEGLDDE